MELTKLETDLAGELLRAQQLSEQFSSKEHNYKQRIANLENDLRITYKKHKKDLAELNEQYRHENYKERYNQLAIENARLA